MSRANVLQPGRMLCRLAHEDSKHLVGEPLRLPDVFDGCESSAMKAIYSGGQGSLV